MFKRATEEQILNWIKTKKIDFFGKHLISSTVHGKPGIPLAEIGRIEKILNKNFTELELFSLGKILLKRPEYTSRRIGIGLVIKAWPNSEIEILLKEAADDEDWQVRESAAGVFAVVLGNDFAHFSKLFLKWIKSESDNIKRAIALAVKYDSKAGDESKWNTYIKIINPLMSESSEYIRKNLGPFAIGDGLLSRFPKQTIESCQEWVYSKNENVRWNTAMIFTSAASKKFAKEGRKFLAVLVKDESQFVAKAAQKALKNLK